jgi:drug/metabolite transporter (DMT)-like permease
VRLLSIARDKGAPLSKPLAVGALLLNATTWGLAWWPIRQLTLAGLHPLWATALIFATATLGIALVFRGKLASGWRNSRGLWWLMLASGLTNASFNWAVTLTDVARVALLFYLMPVWAALLARWLLKEPLSWLVVARICAALGGAAFVFLDPNRPPGAGSWMADALAVAAGMTFAVNTVMLRKIAGQSRAATALAMFGGGALLPLAVALLLAVTGHALPPLPAPAPVWLALVLATALAFLAGNLALQYGAARLPANTAALIMLTEVFVAAVSGAVLAGEALSGRVLLGGVLIIAAAASSLLTPGTTSRQRQATV